MKVYYGLEISEKIDIQTIEHFDYDENLIIFEGQHSLQETNDTEIIPLLYIKPHKTTLLLEDYGFFSESGKCYMYLDMICTFSIVNGEEQQIAMFMLQVDEELIAKEGEEEPIFILDKHNIPLIKKWALSYKVEIEFILS